MREKARMCEIGCKQHAKQGKRFVKLTSSFSITVGAPQARAQELMDATSTAIFRYISMMMFEQHFTLLQLLVSVERMRMNRKASTKELSLFINGFDKQGLDEVALLESKPNGMTNQVNFCIQFRGVLCDVSGLFLDFNPKFQDIKKKCY